MDTSNFNPPRGGQISKTVAGPTPLGKYCLDQTLRSAKSSKSLTGFTLIEVVVGIFIFSIISIGLIVLITQVLKAGNQQGSLVSDEDSARKTIFAMTNELRNAQNGSDGSYPLAQASGQEVVFFAPVVGMSGVQRVHYYVKNGNMYKGITVYANNTYNTTTESSIIVQRDLNSNAGAIFLYYDSNYTGSSSQASLTDPVNVTQVRFVKINLPIYNVGGVTDTNTYFVSGGATIRGLKTNLNQ